MKRGSQLRSAKRAKQSLRIQVTACIWRFGGAGKGAIIHHQCILICSDHLESDRRRLKAKAGKRHTTSRDVSQRRGPPLRATHHVVRRWVDSVERVKILSRGDWMMVVGGMNARWSMADWRWHRCENMEEEEEDGGGGRPRVDIINKRG